MKQVSNLKLLLTVVFIFFVSGCGGVDRSGDSATVGVAFESYTTAQMIRHPWWMEVVAPKAHAAISAGSLRFCFKRLRLKLADQFDDSDQSGFDPESDEDNIDFLIGEVVIDPDGTDLGEITAPVGTYRRIEFDLESDCSSGNSVSLVNDNGAYTSQERITIKFDGDFIVEKNGDPIVLPLGLIISNLNSFSASRPDDQDRVSEELKEAAELTSTSL